MEIYMILQHINLKNSKIKKRIIGKKIKHSKKTFHTCVLVEDFENPEPIISRGPSRRIASHHPEKRFPPLNKSKV